MLQTGEEPQHSAGDILLDLVSYCTAVNAQHSGLAPAAAQTGLGTMQDLARLAGSQTRRLMTDDKRCTAQ